MEVDEPFAAYVAARWSMHYRLAALLAGEDAADALTQAALVRAYASWQDVTEAASVDERVKEILVKTAVAGPEVPFPEARTNGEHLWSRFSALPVRQRAELVLGAYEYLPDHEIARILRRRGGDVEAETLAGLASLGISRSDLGAELARVAEEVDIPLPPSDELLARGHEERRSRRRRTLGRSVAVVAIVVTGLAVTGLVEATRSGRSAPTVRPIPSSLSGLPHGDEPAIAYVEARTLHVRGAPPVVLLEQPRAIARAGTWVYVTYASGQIWRMDPEAMETAIVVDDSRGQLVADPTGQRVAWLDASPAREVPSVSVSPVDDDRAAVHGGWVQFGGARGSGPFVVNGLTRTGELIASRPLENRAWIWDVDGNGGTPPREISGLGNGVIRQLTVDEVVVQYGPAHYAAGQVEGETFLVRDEINARQADFDDPSVARILYVDGAGTVRVRARTLRLGTSTPPPVRLRLPALDQGYAGVWWEDASHVLLDVTDSSMPDGALVRCDVEGGDCEIALRFDGPHLVAN